MKINKVKLIHIVGILIVSILLAIAPEIKVWHSLVIIFPSASLWFLLCYGTFGKKI